MTKADQGGTPAEREAAIAEFDAAWARLEAGLTTYLSSMGDPDGADHLLLELGVAGDELPDDEDDLFGAADQTDEGCAPYAQFASFGDGTMLRAEITGNCFLSPAFRLGRDAGDYFASHGWSGNDADGDLEERNWYLEVPIEQAGLAARQAAWVLRYFFGIAHPGLLTYRAWGAAVEGADVLGLCATDDVPFEAPPAPDGGELPVVFTPTSREELLGCVRAVLEVKYAEEPDVDQDDDFVLDHHGQTIWVRVRDDQPAIEIMACVAHKVHSRRATAIELGLLNRDNLWVRWVLRERTIWQTMVLPGLPFAPMHLDGMLDVFMHAIDETRDDLVLRTGARAA